MKTISIVLVSAISMSSVTQAGFTDGLRKRFISSGWDDIYPGSSIKLKNSMYYIPKDEYPFFYKGDNEMRVKIKSVVSRKEYCLKMQKITNENRGAINIEFQQMTEMLHQPSGPDRVYYAKQEGSIVKYVMNGQCHGLNADGETEPTNFGPNDFASDDTVKTSNIREENNEPRWGSSTQFPPVHERPNFVLRDTNQWSIPGGNPSRTIEMGHANEQSHNWRQSSDDVDIKAQMPGGHHHGIQSQQHGQDPNFVLRDTNQWSIPGGNPPAQNTQTNVDPWAHLGTSGNQNPSWLTPPEEKTQTNDDDPWAEFKQPDATPDWLRMSGNQNHNPSLPTEQTQRPSLRSRINANFASSQFENIYQGGSVKILKTLYRIPHSRNSYEGQFEKRVRVQSLKTFKKYCLKVLKIPHGMEHTIQENLQEMQTLVASGDERIKYAKQHGDTAVYLTKDCSVGLSLDDNGHVVEGANTSIPGGNPSRTIEMGHANEQSHNWRQSSDDVDIKAQMPGGHHHGIQSQQHGQDPNFVLRDTNQWSIPGGNPPAQNTQTNVDPWAHLGTSGNQNPSWLTPPEEKTQTNDDDPWAEFKQPDATPDWLRMSGNQNHNPSLPTEQTQRPSLRSRINANFASSQFENIYQGGSVKILKTLYRIPHSRNSYEGQFEKRVRVQSLKTFKKYCLKVLKIPHGMEHTIQENLQEMQTLVASGDERIKYAKQHGDTAVYLTKDCSVGLSLDDNGHVVEGANTMRPGNRFTLPRWAKRNNQPNME